jgi:hypothetical protein
MEYGSKVQPTDINNLERASVHELWEGGDSTRTFTKAEGWPRALRVDVAGTLIVKDQQSSPVQVTYNVIQGEIIPFAFSEIDTTSGASVQIWW